MFRLRDYAVHEGASQTAFVAGLPCAHTVSAQEAAYAYAITAAPALFMQLLQQSLGSNASC